MKTYAKYMIFAALIGFAAPALAEDVSVHTLCQMVPEYTQPAGVEYEPGVDVHGRIVGAADVNKVLNNNFDAVEIPVEYSVLNSLGASLPAGSKANAAVAILRVYGDGRVKYNDQDLTPQAQSLCSSQVRMNPAPVAQPLNQGQYYNPNMEPRVLGQVEYSGTAKRAATPVPDIAYNPVAYVPQVQPVSPPRQVLRNPQDIPW